LDDDAIAKLQLAQAALFPKAQPDWMDLLTPDSLGDSFSREAAWVPIVLKQKIQVPIAQMVQPLNNLIFNSQWYMAADPECAGKSDLEDIIKSEPFFVGMMFKVRCLSTERALRPPARLHHLLTCNPSHSLSLTQAFKCKPTGSPDLFRAVKGTLWFKSLNKDNANPNTKAHLLGLFDWILSTYDTKEKRKEAAQVAVAAAAEAAGAAAAAAGGGSGRGGKKSGAVSHGMRGGASGSGEMPSANENVMRECAEAMREVSQTVRELSQKVTASTALHDSQIQKLIAAFVASNASNASNAQMLEKVMEKVNNMVILMGQIVVKLLKDAGEEETGEDAKALEAA
jgi:hypothetical protein